MIELNSITLPKLFPDESSLDKKAWKFLETYYNNRCSIHLTAKRLGIHYRTARSLFTEIKETYVYDDFMALSRVEVIEFADPKFRQSVFKMYEDQMVDIEKRIDEIEQVNESKNSKAVMDLLKLRASIIRDQLKASLLLTKNEVADPSDLREQEEYKRLREEAFREIGRFDA